MIEDLGESGKLVLSHAQRIAGELGGGPIGTGHLFLAVVALEDVIMRRQFTAQGLDLEVIAEEVAQKLTPGGGGGAGGPSFSDAATEALNIARNEASTQGKPIIEAPHILMGVLHDDGGLAARTLDAAGADREALRKRLRKMLDEGRWSADFYKERTAIQQPGIASTSNVVEELGRDLTAEAEAGELSPIVGRDREILEVVQILCGMEKNNAVLIGEAGVGKTAIVEGLAQRIVAGEVPEQLKGMRIRTVEVGSLVAGTQYRGSFEAKLRALIDQVSERKDVILFIDEMHMLAGAGAAEGQPMDAADMLKPVLARGTLKVIGATTTDEFRQHIEPDSALMRRFQQVVVAEPSRDATLEILRGLAPRYEAFHGVKIADDALQAAIDLSVRYMHDRYLPDKALDLLDRACTQEKLRIGMRDWMPSLASEAEAEGVAPPGTDLVVDAEEIAEVVSILLEIPIASLTSDERRRLLGMADALKQRVVGQDDAIVTISETILAVRMGMKDPERPQGVFMFLGPTGVGKTTLAEEIAAFLFGDKHEIVRLDMSEFAEEHTVSGLIGSPPGYVGWAEGGKLTNAVRSKPYSVVLLDEVEKAHPKVWNVFLQVFEDGQLTDNAGRLVDFRNAVIIMTSNVGAREIQASRPIGFVLDEERELSYEDVKREVDKELKRVFAPEFLNRIDEVLVFRPLSKDSLRTILQILLDEMIPLKLEISDAALDFLVDESYEPALGARPTRRAIQRLLRNPLSVMLAKEEIGNDDTVAVGLRKGALTFKRRPAKGAGAANQKAGVQAVGDDAPRV